MLENTTTFSIMSLMQTLERLGRVVTSTNHSDEAQRCYERAQQCAKWAKEARDIETRNAFLRLEAKWQSLAQNVGRDSTARDALLRLDAMWHELAARQSSEATVISRQSALFEILQRRTAVQARSQSGTPAPPRIGANGVRGSAIRTRGAVLSRAPSKFRDDAKFSVAKPVFDNENQNHNETSKKY
jgi:hypothetical protein